LDRRNKVRKVIADHAKGIVLVMANDAQKEIAHPKAAANRLAMVSAVRKGIGLRKDVVNHHATASDVPKGTGLGTANADRKPIVHVTVIANQNHVRKDVRHAAKRTTSLATRRSSRPVHRDSLDGT
jgi:galactokinase/mevalonate kinase-like predicted kinase